MGALSRLFAEDGLPPHGFCLLWDPALVWLHAASDAAIGISYYLIPLALAWFVWHRRDVVFGWIFWMFAAFILACGTTHFIEIWVLWHPAYGLQGLVKAVTALISVATAVALWPLLPRAMALPSPAEFRQVAELLSAETAARQRVARQYQESETSFQLLVEGVTDHAIFMLDPSGNVTSWNSGAQRISGYAAGEVLGTSFTRFHTQEDLVRDVARLSLETAAQTGKAEGEGWRVRKDGSRFWAHAVIEPLYDGDGVLRGFAKIVRDITARREAEEALDQARATLAQSQKMEAIGQLTGGVAHDFNNLLTAILGSIELLELRLDSVSEASRRLLAVIRQAAERGTTLSSHLLAFARKQALTPQTTDLNRLVGSMSDLLRRTLGDHVVIETVLAGGLWMTHVDPNQMENCLLNLAVNARDAMPEGGKLTIETGNAYLDAEYAAANGDVTPGQYVLVAVSDSGEGMSPDVRQRAFEPFYTTKDAGKGTGLGLSQVYGFVKQSGGHIKIYSEPGHGTTMKLYLPRHSAAEAPDAASESGMTAGLPRGSETILLVEDDDAVREYGAGAVTHLGYTVLQAGEAAAALALIEAHPEIALLFTDVGLPGMNGRRLADAALRQRPDLKVVYTTAYARNAIVHHGVLDAGVHLLPKPFTMAALARMLRHVLDDA